METWDVVAAALFFFYPNSLSDPREIREYTYSWRLYDDWPCHELIFRAEILALAYKLGAVKLASFVTKKFQQSKEYLRPEHFRQVFGPFEGDETAEAFGVCLDSARGDANVALVLLTKKAVQARQAWREADILTNRAKLEAEIHEFRYQKELGTEKHATEYIRLLNECTRASLDMLKAKDRWTGLRPVCLEWWKVISE